jgi:hypothetical protein
VQDRCGPRADDAPMNAVTTSRTTPCIAVGRASRHPMVRLREALQRVARQLRTHWQHLWLDDRTRYLNAAVDHVDLERRLRALDDPGWRAPY